MKIYYKKGQQILNKCLNLKRKPITNRLMVHNHVNRLCDMLASNIQELNLLIIFRVSDKCLQGLNIKFALFQVSVLLFQQIMQVVPPLKNFNYTHTGTIYV